MTEPAAVAQVTTPAPDALKLDAAKAVTATTTTTATSTPPPSTGELEFSLRPGGGAARVRTFFR